jgi:hypothetical protein
MPARSGAWTTYPDSLNHFICIHDYQQKEKMEDIYRKLPHMRPLWMRKDFDF